MTKQLLIYGAAEAVNKQKHKEWSVKSGADFSFASEVISVPLTAVEFIPASQDFAIVFSGEGDNIMPVAVMGVRENENLYIKADGSIDATYAPAFLRRYPFVFSSNDEGSNFTLCIDEGFEGCNQDNRGERLFDSEGEQTQYLSGVLDFLKDYQSHFYRTQAFCKMLKEYDLLEPMGAQFTAPVTAEKLTLTGFMAINRQKLKELSGDKLEKLAKTDALELCYVHLQSMRNFNKMLAKIGVAAPEDAAQAGTQV
jgi:hypothetical protein